MKNWKKYFVMLWSGQAISLLTSAIVQMAIIWYITDYTRSASTLAIASIVAFVPQSILGPFIGVYLDRQDKKTVMLISDLGIALVSLIAGVFVMQNQLSLLMIYIVLFLRALGSAFHSPCLSAVTPQIVPTEDLVKYGGYSQSVQSMSYIISPVLAGVLYAILPMSTLFFIDVVGAVIAVGFLFFIPLPKQEPNNTKMEMIKELKEGLEVVKGAKGLYYIIIISAFFMIVYMPINSLFPLIVLDYFNSSTQIAGIVEASFAVGMLLAGIVLGTWGGFKKKHLTIIFAYVTLGLCLALSGLLPVKGIYIFICLCFLMGFAGTFFNVPYSVLIQEIIPLEFLGRVFTLSTSLMTLTMPIGLALSGTFADKIGVNWWFFYSGIFIVILGFSHFLFKDIRDL